MLGSFRNKRSGIFIWALMLALVIGLAGFGIGAGGGISAQNVARVGDEPITADDYVRAMQQELRALTQQVGHQVTMAEAKQYRRRPDGAGAPRQRRGPRRRGRPARPLDRRRGGARADHEDPGVPGHRRQIRPRQLHLRAGAHQPEPLRVRDPDPPRIDPQPARDRGASRRRHARNRGHDRSRLSWREAQLRLAAPRRGPSARAGARADRCRPHGLARRPRRRKLHPARDPQDQLRQHHPRGAGRGHRDPRRRAAGGL